jgi:hypothetical protein
MISQSSLQITFYHNKVKISPNPSGHWKVDKVVLDSNTREATWECPGCKIFVLFLHARTPLLNGDTEVSGQDSVFTQLDTNAKGYYPYCILVQDADGNFHLVEGNSPPEMIIE